MLTDGNNNRIFGLTDEEFDRRFGEAVRLADEAKRTVSVPLPRFETNTRREYLPHPDGGKQYVVAS